MIRDILAWLSAASLCVVGFYVAYGENYDEEIISPPVDSTVSSHLHFIDTLRFYEDETTGLCFAIITGASRLGITEVPCFKIETAINFRSP
jgi:hypothetical protein